MMQEEDPFQIRFTRDWYGNLIIDPHSIRDGDQLAHFLNFASIQFPRKAIKVSVPLENQVLEALNESTLAGYPFELYFGNEWVFKNESPLPPAASSIAGAKVILINRKGTHLALAHEVTRPHRLDLFGGSLEPGEDCFRAAAREVHEELGLEMDPSQLQLVSLWQRSGANRQGMNDVCFFLWYRPGVDENDPSLHPPEGTPNSRSEISQWEWVPIDELLPHGSFGNRSLNPGYLQALLWCFGPSSPPSGTTLIMSDFGDPSRSMTMTFVSGL